MTRENYSTSLLAERWLVSAETVRQMIVREELKAFKAGKQ